MSITIFDNYLTTYSDNSPLSDTEEKTFNDLITNAPVDLHEIIFALIRIHSLKREQKIKCDDHIFDNPYDSIDVVSETLGGGVAFDSDNLPPQLKRMITKLIEERSEHLEIVLE
jgi:hypothetical protein